MKKNLIYLLLVVSLPGFAQVVTRPVAEHRIDSLVPNNATRTITPERLRKAFGVAMDYAKQVDTVTSKKIVGEMDVISGNLALVVGGVNGTNLRTDSTEKRGRIAVASWSKNRLPYALISGISRQNDGSMYIGGGVPNAYTVNYIQEYTVNSVGTTGGSIRRVVNPDGSHWFGPSPLMDGLNLATFNGNVNVKGTLTTQSVEPVQSGTYRIGSSSLNYGSAYVQQFISNSSALNLRVPATSGIYFNQSATVSDATKIVGGYLENTGEYFIQPPGVKPAAKGVQFANYGTTWLGGAATFTAPWSNYQAVFGSSAQGGRIQFLRGSDTSESLRIGLTSATAATSEINAFSSLAVSSGGTLNLSSSSSSGTNLINTGSSGTVLLSAPGTTGGTIEMQTGANKRFKINTDGTIIYDPSGTFTQAGYGFDMQSTARIAGSLTTGSTTAIVPEINGVGNIGHPNVRFNASYLNVGYFQSGLLIGGTAAIDPSAAFELRSTARGFLINRMSEAQKNAIPSPAEGLMIYQNTGVKGWYGYQDGAWVRFVTTP